MAVKENLMKVLIINYEFPPLGGGGGVASYELALEWAKTCEVEVITSGFKDLEKFENIEGIKVHRVTVLGRNSRDAASFISMLSYLIGGCFKGVSLMRKNKFQVINTHFAVPSGPLGYILGKIFRVPNVLSLHGGDIYDPSKKSSPHRSFIFKGVVKFILNRADRIVAQSSNTRDNALSYYKPKKPVEIIPLAFHIPPEVSTTAKELNLDSKYFYLITVGRLVKRKSIETIVDAMPELDEKIKLIVVGDGPEMDFLQDRVRALSLEERVVFTGYVDDSAKYSYIKNANLFVLTSLHEGFGIVFMEAMYYGLPIVCTNHGGQVDFLKNEENAILIDVGDVKACGEAIARFYGDKKLYKKCSKNNKNQIKEFYADKIALQYMDVFNNIAPKGKRQ